jgi:hypothetical protein
MPRGRMLYAPETARGRVVFLSGEIPVAVGSVAMDARRQGTRVRFDLTWDGDDLCASNVRRTRGGALTRRRRPDPVRLSAGGGSER